MKNIDAARALAIGAGVVIIALTAAAFWLSYAHLAEVALAHGLGAAEERAWAWPATLDLFIVAGELLMLRAALAKRVDFWAIGLTSVGSLGSIVLNVAGVTGDRDPSAVPLLDYVVAAVPPTAALLAFGALMRQVHQALAGHVEVTAPVTVERADDDQPSDTNVSVDEPLEVVTPPVICSGPTSLLPVDLPRREVTAVVPVETRPEVVTPPTPWGAWTPLAWPPSSQRGYVAGTRPMTSSVPADHPRQMVTSQVTITPTELRRQARRLNREVVTATNRPVTIERLREEFGLSRREATELRREVVGGNRS